ncbi:MAG: hypothetical protein DRI90_02640 [Deltaproteobacteria bacterium]|nr:MAG: hypothetical protein DRI90_02640 [Deltaproteobacteria bacterium]
MTYNFDPDTWYANERSHLDAQLKKGALTTETFAVALEDLDRRYDEMIDRLDGTYIIPVNRDGAPR